jgi:hypothetical protein
MAATTPYHKGYSAEDRKRVDRERNKQIRADKRTDKILSAKVIVWDGEGMKLSGSDNPQHYVLFGCSARPDSPLLIEKDGDRLVFEEIADYCLDVAAQYPNAVHLGYYFQYDQNMIIWSLPWPTKQVLYSKGSCVVKRGSTKYYIRMVFRKTIRITRVLSNGDKTTLLIQDFAPFFAKGFVPAYQSLFPTPTDPDNWEIVKQGKADRSEMLFEDLAKVNRYWRAEIVALEELAVEFRRIMFEAGFLLSEWHGPGALANYIRRNNDLIRHEWGGKEENLPAAVHEASKGAYSGGHFEQFKVGYIEGPVYAYDKNSAYPHAFCSIPSLSEDGKWQHVGPISQSEWFGNRNLRSSFGVFKVEWRGCSKDASPEVRMKPPQPLPHRDAKDNITYPPYTNGWYWCPEVLNVMEMAKRSPNRYSCAIVDGWVWEPAREEWPWEKLLQDMYNRRLVLKDNGNPTEMAFKLGPNSMYGKMAQRAGGKEEAPKSHTLPIAGYVTSTCRAAVMRLIMHCRPDSVMSVETDGVFTTTPPDELTMFPMSKKLGDWDMKKYDAMILLQNGVYLLKKDGKWVKPKTRGFAASALTPEIALEHLSRCTPDEEWPILKIKGGESFLGLGTAIARATNMTVKNIRSTNPFKASKLHCTWVPEKKEFDLAGKNTSKRFHTKKHCNACRQGLSAAEAAHDMVINPRGLNITQCDSVPYVLPWEKDKGEVKWSILRNFLDEENGIPAETNDEMI